MGLVAVSGGERARVTRPTPELVIDSLSGTARLLLSQPAGVRNFQDARRFFEIGLVRPAAAHATEDDLRALREAPQPTQIGRASCRDSVCQYVYISVVAGSL